MAFEGSKRIHVIIVAAGIGRRFNNQSKRPKQYELIGKLPVLAHSIQAFDSISISDITVVIHPNDTHWETLSPQVSKHKIHTVIGGSQRHDSVRNGIKSLNAAPQDWVLVHDAARPCVTADEINDLINSCLNNQCGGLLVKPLTDTIKYSEKGECVNKTIDREKLYAALTPQMFRCGDLLKALTVFEADSITDESSAIESQGQKPLMIKGKSSNIKITAFEDLAVAHTLLQQQGRI
ncbi:2-C-methyl-D-erythritol 4-phosphate cytidylyltransferase [Marinicella litoralis]|uniref:2-C-methyl-D-erythritol 4-phosphate cytidylyltransferase n=1 Tax=Marinicella litoralis TaxID=644220 RepID=A0A4R6XLH3_9GAMM|nr:2-C-methyl-D-erythritol 4-phosphate cytidylyltransferase [Marinicella litoralis]TDR20416.1 2-C-methyl-D-erythritol 4-phosphate cytidylyltransferase [Marinicella litoralis]